MLDLVYCDGCKRRFVATQGRALVDAIKTGCPTCHGEFKVIEDLEADLHNRLAMGRRENPLH